MKKLTAIILSLTLVFSCLLTTAVADDNAAETGTTFTANDIYCTTEPLSSVPLTWEVDIEVADDAATSRLGTIVGNYKAGGVDCANLEIRNNGNPQLYMQEGSSTKSFLFDKVNLIGMGRVKLAVTYDNKTGDACCYINGVLKQTLSAAYSIWNGASTKPTGEGTEESPYLITNGAELWYALGSNATLGTGKYYKITNDIYLNDVSIDNWETSDSNRAWRTNTAFSGHIDGDGYIIYGIWYGSSSYWGGLIPYMEGGSIKNLGIAKSYIQGTKAGAFVAQVTQTDTVQIDNCFSDETVTVIGGQNHQAGGIVAYAQNPTDSTAKLEISNCYTKANISIGEGSGSANGILGTAWASYYSIHDCYTVGIPVYSGQDSLAEGTNVYDNYSDTGSKGTILSLSDMQGTNASANMSGLDFADYFEVASVNTPKLKRFTNYNAGNPDIWDGSSTMPDGEGSSESPYLITNGAELWYALESNDTLGTGKYYKITKDIYLNDVSLDNWETSGSNLAWRTRTAFNGHIDGDGHIIYGIWYGSSSYWGGLIPYMEGGSIKNLGIAKSYIQGTKAGAFVAQVTQTDTVQIDNCFSDETVTVIGGQNHQAGGIVAYAQNPTDSTAKLEISNCYTKANISIGEGSGSANGILGTAWASYYSIHDCYTVGIPVYSGQDSLAEGTNVYDNYSDTGSKGTILSLSNMQGTNASVNMSGLDFETAFETVNGNTPKLKKFSGYDGDAVKYITPHFTNVMAVGGDLRSGNVQYLKSAQLYSVALFSDLRTATELKSDITNSDKNLLVYYDMSSTSENILMDHSTNKNNLVYTGNNPPSSTNIPKSEGVYVSAANFYKLEKALEAMPNTVEATVYLPSYYSDTERGGVILGNYTSGGKNTYNLEIYTNGNPRVYIVLHDGTVLNYVFDKVDIRTKTWAHIAVVRDSDADTLTCYLDGVAAQVKSIADFSDFVPSSDMSVGTDGRGTDGVMFAGKIRTLTLYSDARTEDEIVSDITAADKTDANLLGDYSFDKGTNLNIADGSANNNALLNQGYISSVPELDDYAYSFAVIGDTQIVTRAYPEKLSCIYDWIANNIESKNIQHVFGLGDITDWDTDNEWKVATSEIAKLDGKVSYSLIRGNHDSSAQFDKYLAGDASYSAQYDGAYSDGSALNTYKLLRVGEVDYLFLSLDYGFDDNVIAWASEIIKAHPNHNVVITTHAYLYRDGTTLDANDVCPPSVSGGTNNGDDIWDKFISKHENIVLVLSGHDPSANIVTTQTVGDNGNIVTQMLIDPQGLDANADAGPTGMVTMLYFSEDGKTIQVRNYSTVKEMYYGQQNQFAVYLDTVVPTMGDANDDGVVDICDLVTVANAVGGKEIKYNFNTADVCNDDVIDSYDLAVLRRYLITGVLQDDVLRLSEQFGDNMVLQRDESICVYGTGKGTGRITVGDQVKTVTSESDSWEVYFEPMTASATPVTFKTEFSGVTKEYENVLIGDVYIAAGQSNMEMTLGATEQSGTVDKNSMLRFQNINDPVWSEFNQTATGGIENISAIGTLFAQELSVALDNEIPVGIISVSVGASRIEDWTHSDYCYCDEYDLDNTAHSDYTFYDRGHHDLYTAHIEPIEKMTTAGVLWYQGESNRGAGEACRYLDMFKTMVDCWRTRMDDPDLPFYTVQIMLFSEDTAADVNGNAVDEYNIRIAQGEAARTMENVTVCTMLSYEDTLTNTGVLDIHPTDKAPIAKALANAVLTNYYNPKGEYDGTPEYSGPLYDTVTVDGNTATVTFTHVAEGLMLTQGDTVSEIEVRDVDGSWVTATGTLSGNTVTVTADVDEITGVRMGYRNRPILNLYNTVDDVRGYCASPFVWIAH